jgi:hypothetical protein
MTENGLYGTQRRKGGTNYNCFFALLDCHFFVSPNEREREEVGEIRRVLQTMYMYFDMLNTRASILDLGYIYPYEQQSFFSEEL